MGAKLRLWFGPAGTQTDERGDKRLVSPACDKHLLESTVSLPGRSDYSSADASEGRQVGFLFSQLLWLRGPNQTAPWRDYCLACHLQGHVSLLLIDDQANAG